MALLPGDIEGRDAQTASVPMPRLSHDASTILSYMKALHVDAGDYVLVDAFISLLEDNEHRFASALDELIKLKLVVATPDNDALAMTKAGARYRTIA